MIVGWDIGLIHQVGRGNAMAGVPSVDDMRE